MYELVPASTPEAQRPRGRGDSVGGDSTMMKSMLIFRRSRAAGHVFMLLGLLLISSAHLVVSAEEESISLTFRNELPEPIMVYFEGAEQRIPQGEDPIPSHGGELSIRTFPGHRFTYDYGGERHWIEAKSGRDLEILLADKTEILVKCTTTANGFRTESQPLNIRVIPWWSPRGASRFLELVRDNYYDGCALNRVVPHFLTQFGIGADVEKRRRWRERAIMDDTKQNIAFIPGMISYAGSGPDSRYGEVFIVMPDTPQGQLDHFGTNSWETPFGIVEGNLEDTPISRWHVTGDFLNGSGPDPQRMYREDGYEYLSKEFPELDYIEQCVVEEIVQEEQEL